MSFWSSANISPARKYRFKTGPAGNVWWYTNTVTLPSFEINTNEYQLINQKFRYPGVTTWNPVTISVVDVADSVEQLKKVLSFSGFEFFQKQGLQKGLALEARQALLQNIDAQTEILIRGSQKQAISEQKAADIFLGSTYTDEQTQTPAEKAADRNRIIRANAELQKKALNPVEANDFVIQQMKDDGQVLRTWTLVNSFISSINYGDLDYASDDLVSIEIVVTYDYATTDK